MACGVVFLQCHKAVDIALTAGFDLASDESRESSAAALFAWSIPCAVNDRSALRKITIHLMAVYNSNRRAISSLESSDITVSPSGV